MIKVCFPPGCYGTYFARCLYNYTNLRPGDFEPLEFDTAGSSHAHRKDHDARQTIQCEHFNAEILQDIDSSIVVILPSHLHCLDYYNNQFVKQGKSHLISYIESQLPSNEIKQKLESGWNYTQPFNQETPTWILREFFSFWIVDCLHNGYSIKQYSQVVADAVIDTQDIFLNFESTFADVCLALGLEINIDHMHIAEGHVKFLNSQQFHLSQKKCQQWVYDAIKGCKDTPNTCQTIFDEAYVQYFLRDLGYELQCDGLNQFPPTAKDLHNIIYK